MKLGRNVMCRGYWLAGWNYLKPISWRVAAISVEAAGTGRFEAMDRTIEGGERRQSIGAAMVLARHVEACE